MDLEYGEGRIWNKNSYRNKNRYRNKNKLGIKIGIERIMNDETLVSEFFWVFFLLYLILFVDILLSKHLENPLICFSLSGLTSGLTKSLVCFSLI